MKIKFNHRRSLVGSIIAFVVGTSCCWLSSLAIWLGGATLLVYISSWIERYQFFILGISLACFLLAIFQWKFKIR